MNSENKLNDKQSAFVDAYLRTFNATKAAKEAGYSEKTAYSIGHNLLKQVEIKDALRVRYEANAMTANELLHHLAEIARGNIDDVIDNKGNLDLARARELGKSPLIKSVRSKTVLFTDKDGEGSETFESEVGMYDRMKALELIGKHLAMFTDKVESVTWRTKAIDDIRAGKYTHDEIAALFGDNDLADTLFREAGITIAR